MNAMLQVRPLLPGLVGLMFLDVIMGLLCAFATKEVSSTASWVGMSRKVGTLVVVTACCVVDPWVPAIALGRVVCLFYCITETISVLENAGRFGVPLPRGVLAALTKLRGSKAPVTRGKAK